MNSFRKAIVLACASAFCASGAIAATQTLNGTAFDISYDDAVVGLFGTPTLLGNSLFFAPGGSPGFSAQTDGGLDVTNSTFSFTISANQGYTLNTFALLEEGDYFYFGSVAGVAASGQLRVKPLEPLASTLTAALSPSSFVANSAFDFTTQNWSAGATIDSGSVTVAQVSIQNILAAWAQPGAGELPYSFIEKKNVELSVGVTAVPEPQTYALMLAGLGMVGFAARRRLNRSA